MAPSDRIVITAVEVVKRAANTETKRTLYGYSCMRGDTVIVQSKPRFADKDVAESWAAKAIDAFDRKINGTSRLCSVQFDAQYATRAIGAPWQATSPSGHVVGRGHTPAQAFAQAKAKGWRIAGELPAENRSAETLRAQRDARRRALEQELSGVIGTPRQEIEIELQQINELER